MTSHSNKGLSQKGFTLLEVLISIVIMAFISLGIYQATTESYKLREELVSDSDFYNEIRLTMAAQRDPRAGGGGAS